MNTDYVSYAQLVSEALATSALLKPRDPTELYPEDYPGDDIKDHTEENRDYLLKNFDPLFFEAVSEFGPHMISKCLAAVKDKDDTELGRLIRLEAERSAGSVREQNA